ncbi:MAG: hypothetical protein AMXMBFR7_13720 [Planctomycetota bacterium]
MTPRTKFDDEYGIGSVDLVEILLEVDERYGVWIPCDLGIPGRTVGDAIAYIRNQQVKRNDLYCVLVDDNSRNRDEATRYEHGRFADRNTALTIARTIVDHSLARLQQTGMTPNAWLKAYRQFGLSPFIVCNEVGPIFSSENYAEKAVHTHGTGHN